MCSFHNGEWWYCFIQIKRLIIYGTCRWMCVIPVYDYGELKVLLFRLVADGRLQVKINGWDCCLEHLVWSKEFLPFCRNLNMSPLMCYSVDCALHRYENSLKNTGDAYFKECLQLMKTNPKHFSLGLKIFKDGRKSSYFRGLVWSSVQWRKFCGHCCGILQHIVFGKKCSAGISFRWLMKRSVNNGWNGWQLMRFKECQALRKASRGYK